MLTVSSRPVDTVNRLRSDHSRHGLPFFNSGSAHRTPKDLIWWTMLLAERPTQTFGQA